MKLTLDFVRDISQAVAPLVSFVVERESAVEEDEGEAAQGPDVDGGRVVLALNNFWGLRAEISWSEFCCRQKKRDSKKRI